jgi:hypothetical protein
MNDILIKDCALDKSIKISFSEFYDLKIGLECAIDEYGSIDMSEKVKNFKKLMTKINKIIN